jgi:hypothetical protein
MRNRRWMQLLCLSSVIPVVLASGCGGSGGDGTGTLQSKPGGVSVASGLMVASRECASCHDSGDGSYSGRTTSIVFGAMVFPPNLTPDKDTGIGSWSDDNIKTAIREGRDNQNNELCKAMPRWTGLSDDEVSSIVMFLRSLPPVSKQVPTTVCK